jgi:hypothetical protein
MSGADGSASFPALSLTGTYAVTVSKQGFGDETRSDITLRSGETATLRVKLLIGPRRRKSPSSARPRACAPTRRSACVSTASTIDETPILGRKVTTLPLFNSAFRQGKGTGDLFVNATLFHHRLGQAAAPTTFMLDGASNDEGWGPQTMLTTVPLGAVQEAHVLTNAFSRVRLDAGPAFNIVTKSGTNAVRGEALYMARPGGWQAKTFSTDGLLRAVGARRASTPASLLVRSFPTDLPRRVEHQVSGLDRRSRRRRSVVLRSSQRLTRAGSEPTPASRDAARVRAAVGRQPERIGGPLPAGPGCNGRFDHKRHGRRSQLMVAATYDHSTTPTRTTPVVGTERADRRAPLTYAADRPSVQGDHTTVRRAAIC